MIPISMNRKLPMPARTPRESYPHDWPVRRLFDMKWWNDLWLNESLRWLHRHGCRAEWKVVETRYSSEKKAEGRLKMKSLQPPYVHFIKLTSMIHVVLTASHMQKVSH